MRQRTATKVVPECIIVDACDRPRPDEIQVDDAAADGDDEGEGGAHGVLLRVPPSLFSSPLRNLI